jgi:translation initiation factor IF-2
MGKKRVHEIAKDLGYQNQDFIEKLRRLGFDVKTHSSTIDEEDVRRALSKEENERKQRTDESRVSGSVIRRRPRDGTGSAGTAPATPSMPAAPSAAPTTVLRRAAPTPSGLATPTTPPAVVVRRAADPTPVVVEDTMGRAVEPSTAHTTDEQPALPVQVAAHDDSDVSTHDVVETAPVTETPAHTTDPTPVVEPVVVAEPPVVESVPVVAAAATDDLDAKRERREARPNRPDARKRDEEEEDEEDDKAHLELESLGISEDDFAEMAAERAADTKGTRVAPPPPSSKPVTMQKEEEPQARVVRSIDPEVLKARLSGAKRPEPPKDWGKTPDVAASPRTELEVRTDASGKRKELVDVRKDAAKGKPGKVGAKKREEMSAKDLLEHRRGQVYYPTPGRKRVKGRKGAAKPSLPAAGTARRVELGESITVAELAKQMGRKATELIGWLMREGIMASINQPISNEIAQSVADEFGFEVTSKVFDEESLLDNKDKRLDPAADPDAVLRAPVVTVMGHVDHGKTTLLDRIRKTNVAGGEAGGITQAIAGYQVKTSKGNITFLDTPGHAAFTAMRARGANITDIVILVVAADDGVMPQTIEAISHAKAADVPIIVAVNKVDKTDANPDRVLQQLTQHGIVVEDWGGDVLSRRISAKTGDGVEELLEQLALQAEIMELKANPKLPARATVIEAEIHKGRGPVATVLVLEGTLRVGDAVVVGEAIGKVRALIADGGRRVTEAGPSVPVQILGLDAVPQPADELRVAKSLEDAREIADFRKETRRATEQTVVTRVSLQDLFAKMGAGEDAQKELKIIVKADVQGSVEALKGALVALTTPKVKVSVIQGSVGAVVESDVEFAKSSDAIIIGFGVRPDTAALKAARAMGIDIRTHSIIYECVDEVRLAMEGLLAPVSKEQYLGRAEVRQVFNVPKIGTIAGCMVIDGALSRSSQIRVLRDSKPVHEGKLASLKRFKDDVREVKEGFECGTSVEKFNDVRVGDVIEAFEIVQVKANLDEPVGPAKPEARA